MNPMFFPPGVQCAFADAVARPIPASAGLSEERALKLLWQQRNLCSETEIAAIDADMLRLALEIYWPSDDRSAT